MRCTRRVVGGHEGDAEDDREDDAARRSPDDCRDASARRGRARRMPCWCIGTEGRAPNAAEWRARAGLLMQAADRSRRGRGKMPRESAARGAPPRADADRGALCTVPRRRARQRLRKRSDWWPHGGAAAPRLLASRRGCAGPGAARARAPCGFMCMLFVFFRKESSTAMMTARRCDRRSAPVPRASTRRVQARTRSLNGLAERDEQRLCAGRNAQRRRGRRPQQARGASAVAALTSRPRTAGANGSFAMAPGQHERERPARPAGS